MGFAGPLDLINSFSNPTGSVPLSAPWAGVFSVAVVAQVAGAVDIVVPAVWYVARHGQEVVDWDSQALSFSWSLAWKLSVGAFGFTFAVFLALAPFFPRSRKTSDSGKARNMRSRVRVTVLISAGDL